MGEQVVVVLWGNRERRAVIVLRGNWDGESSNCCRKCKTDLSVNDWFCW